ncbi:hypothetical protein E4L95_15260 [Paracoccus liaowanqingii]|uniref:Uncharacterized protein n=1 Tax=Paracoccus liaowanqingii TaxID=2560053 RepID=A0A4Z1CFG1_9RHOB|nr:hypothetical protein [Paracoccus liaowanqingii]TGN54892.1 hypothetical protein E4L95_15260 [Paracoccus liaowanqingii]
MMNEQRGAVVAACLAVLTREIYAAGVDRDTALALLRDAPDKIEAALTRGFRAMVVYRLDGRKARGLVSDQDDKLRAFEAQARQDRAPLVGINPTLVADLAAVARDHAALTMGARHAVH